ncbi:MAG: 50S ribosomal protein L3 [Bdellovibrionales bacterium]
MSEATEVKNEDTAKAANSLFELKSIFAFKVGMTTYFNEGGEAIAATVLRYEPLVVSQIKTKETDGYSALQVAFSPKRDKRTSKSEKNHLKATGFENGTYFVREIRQDIPEGVSVGAKIAIDSLKIGETIKVTSKSKGKGFAGVVKRWGVAGGPETHGSGFHRHPGSVGNRTWPGRVMPGKKFPGRLGDENVTVKNAKIVDILTEDNVIIVSGSIPGSENTLVKITKV